MNKTEPLRVIHVLEATDGGTGRYIKEVIPALCAAGVQVHLVCSLLRNPGYQSVVAHLEKCGATVTRFDMVRDIRVVQDLKSLIKLWRFFRQHDADVIHVHSSKAGALGRLAALAAKRRPVIYTPHAFSFLDSTKRLSSRFFFLVERALAGCTDHLVAVSDSESRLTMERGLLPEHRISVVANGISIAKGSESGFRDSKLGGPDQPRLRLGAIGRFESQKDPMSTLRLAETLKQRGLDFELRMLGDGSMLDACRRFCQAVGLNEQIQFLGHVSDPSEFYRSIDVLVSTARYEGLPYSLLDASMLKLPIVAFDVVGVHDLIRTGENGVLVSQGDISALARSVERLAQEPALRAKMGEQANRIVSQDFRLDHQVDGLIRLYHSVVRKKRNVRAVPEPPPIPSPSDRRRVLFVSHTGHLGGAERSLLELIRSLNGRVEAVLACPYPSELAESAQPYSSLLPLSVPSLDRPRGIIKAIKLLYKLRRASSQLSYWMNQHRIQLVHSNSTKAQLLVGKAARRNRIPSVWHWRDFYDNRRINRFLTKTTDRSIAISKSVYNFAYEQTEQKKNLQIVKNGIPDYWPSESQSALNSWRAVRSLEDSAVVVAVVGQLIPRKNHEDVICAARQAIQAQPNLQFVFAYPQNDSLSVAAERRLRSLIWNAEMDGHFHLLRYQPDITELMTSSDILVIPSQREPFGRVAVEAMMARRPVIAYDVDGLSEIVVDGQTGRLIEPNNIEQLSSAIAELASDRTLCEKMGRAGRERAHREFNVTRVASEVMEIYEQMIHEEKPEP